MGTSDQGSLGYVHVSPQVTGGGSLGYVHVSPQVIGGGGPWLMSMPRPTILYCQTSLTMPRVLWGSIPGSCQALYDLSLLLSPASSPVSPVFLLSSSPPYFLLLEHSTSTPTPERFSLQFLLS